MEDGWNTMSSSKTSSEWCSCLISKHSPCESVSLTKLFLAVNRDFNERRK